MLRVLWAWAYKHSTPILVCLLLFSLDWTRGYFSLCISGQQQQAAKCAEEGYGISQSFTYGFLLWLDGWVTLHQAFIVAGATIAIAIFTLTLWRSTDRLWDAGERQLRHFKSEAARSRLDRLKDTQRVTEQIEIARQASEAANKSANAAIAANQVAVTNAEQQLRAYVTARDVSGTAHHAAGYLSISAPNNWAQGAIQSYMFSVVLKNGGQTPAVNLRTNTSFQFFNASLPETFTFPDSAFVGHGVIGPEAEYFANVGEITMVELNPDRGGDWIIWGWVEYDDVFSGTSKHRTEFSFKIDRKNLSDGQLYLRFLPLQKFNGVDGGCMRPFNPHENTYG